MEDINKQKSLSIRLKTNRFHGRKSGNNYFRSIKQQLEHDFRTEKSNSPGYFKKEGHSNVGNYYFGSKVKPSWTHGNKPVVDDLINKAIAFHDKAKEDYEKHNFKQKWQPKTNEFMTGLLTFSEGFDAPPTQVEAMTKCVYRFIQKKFGNCISVVYHSAVQEEAGHFHWTMANYDFRTHKTISRDTFSKNYTKDLQDEIADHLKVEGFDFGHVRGKSKSETGSENISVLQGKVNKLENTIKTLTEQLKEQCNDLISGGYDEASIKRKLKVGLKYADKKHTDKLQKLLTKLENKSKAKRSDDMDQTK